MSSGPNREYSEYQRKVIRRFYENREEGDQQRLAELVSNLYLATGKKREKLWTTARDMMVRLGVPTKRVDHILQSDNPALVAAVVEEIQRGVITPPPKQDNRPNPD
jgi:hypothetical protein